MEWLTSIRTAIDYMENHLEDNISAQDVADHVYLSPFFLQKGFSLMTGYGIGEYIRNRRLYLAALDLKETKDKVIDIALRYCYETPESFTKAFIKIGYFETDADLLYQDEIHGPLLEQVDKAIDLIYTKYMRAKITYEGIQRKERYFVPEAALREALFNAICHKQYQSRIPIQVSVYDDRLYVANIGSLPENWTLDNLLGKHASKPYNPDIASVFYLAGYIESWGRGVEKICEALEKDGLPMPEYTVHPGDIMIKFTGPEDRIIRFSEKVTDRVTDRVTDKVTEKELKVLELLSEDPGYTMPQLAEIMSVSRKTITTYIKSLKEKGLIERIGSDRKGYWKIKI